MGQFAGDMYLNAQMLLAMPSMEDTRFERSLIYICAHSKEGAMGIVVNKPTSEITFPELLERLDIIPEEDRINIQPNTHSNCSSASQCNQPFNCISCSNWPGPHPA